jgi:hypothetical protein
MRSGLVHLHSILVVVVADGGVVHHKRCWSLGYDQTWRRMHRMKSVSVHWSELLGGLLAFSERASGL